MTKSSTYCQTKRKKIYLIFKFDFKENMQIKTLEILFWRIIFTRRQIVLLTFSFSFGKQKIAYCVLVFFVYFFINNWIWFTFFFKEKVWWVFFSCFTCILMNFKWVKKPSFETENSEASMMIGIKKKQKRMSLHNFSLYNTLKSKIQLDQSYYFQSKSCWLIR